jgi:uncharacterized protein YecT (DUF1311 family)
MATSTSTNKRVEVAIVIPADWDERPGHTGDLRPNQPCDLTTNGNFPPIVSLSCHSTPAEAQTQGGASFNCNNAQRSDEILICQSDELSALDRELSSIYFRLRNSLSGAARDQLENGQARWLRSRMQCGRDADCVENAISHTN